MKYLIVLLIALSITFAGCKDSWLNDIEPQGKLLESNYYQTTEEIENGLIATYNMFKNQYWQGTWSSWYMASSLPSDDAVCNYGDRNDRPEMWELDLYTSTPITVGIPQIWNRIYYGVYRANVVIARVDPLGGGDNLAMIAEARMLRAYFYFDLIKFFGQGPLIDHVLTPAEYDQPKATEAEIFALIVKDLTKAAVDLPVRWSDAKDGYRMTKYAAHGLLGKVFTYMASPYYNIPGGNYYDSAKVQLKTVIDNGGYALEPNYGDIWYYLNEFNNETLIEMSYGYDPGTGFAPGFGQELVSNVIQQLTGPRGLNANDTLNAGWGFDMITQDLVDKYRDQGDSLRLHGTALAEWQMREWGLSGFDARGDYTGYTCMKRATWKAMNPGATPWGYGNNERILRLADIYLLYAEACAETGDDASAITYCNLVRTRVGLGSIEDAPGATMLDKIKLERRLELGAEGQRFFDLVRWNDAEAVLTPLGYTPAYAHYAIPQIEIDASHGVLEQNPLYP